MEAETNDQLNGYELSRKWFDFSFDNPEKISPNHSAIFFFAVEHNNRLGWRRKFGFPSQMAMDAIGIKKHSTYIRYFRDLIEWGFFELIQASKNQYSSNIISLNNALPKKGSALGKAIVKHAAKQTRSMRQSKRSIDKPLNHKPLNHITMEDSELDEEINNLKIHFGEYVRLSKFEEIEFRKKCKDAEEFQELIDDLNNTLRTPKNDDEFDRWNASHYKTLITYLNWKKKREKGASVTNKPSWEVAEEKRKADLEKKKEELRKMFQKK